MLQPGVDSLHQIRHGADWVLQLMRLDPQLAIPAAMPLLAARLMDAGGVEESLEDLVEDNRQST